MDQKELLVRNIRYVVSSAMNRLKLQSTKEFEWLFIVAKELYGEVLAGQHMPSLAVAHIDVDKVRVAKLPPDFIRHVKIGVKSGNRVYTLTQDDTLCNDIIPQICGIPPQTTANNDTSYFVDHEYLGSVAPALYMEGGGVNSNYYTVDLLNKEVTLDAAIAGQQLVVEYLSTGKDINEQTVVPTPFVDTMRKYLILEYTKIDGQVSERVREQKVRRLTFEYQESILDARAVLLTPTIEELLDVLYETSSHAFR